MIEGYQMINRRDLMLGGLAGVAAFLPTEPQRREALPERLGVVLQALRECFFREAFGRPRLQEGYWSGSFSPALGESRALDG